jgi:sugar phosphate isomerase/epimerase
VIPLELGVSFMGEGLARAMGSDAKSKGNSVKIGFCTIAWRKRALDLDDMVHIVRLLGYDGIEIWAEHLKPYEGAISSLAMLLKHASLEVPIVSPYFDFTSTELRWRQSIEDAKKYIAIASEIGCGMIRCFTGSVGSRLVSRDGWARCVEGIRVAADQASRAGVEIAIETHVNTLADGVASTKKLVQDVGMKNVGLVLDFYNLYELEERFSPLRAIEALYENTFHIHAKNGKKRLGPISPFNYVMTECPVDGIRTLADGVVDYGEIFRELQSREYERYVSIECFESRRNPIRSALDDLSYARRFQAKMGNCAASAFRAGP